MQNPGCWTFPADMANPLLAIGRYELDMSHTWQPLELTFLDDFNHHLSNAGLSLLCAQHQCCLFDAQGKLLYRQSHRLQFAQDAQDVTLYQALQTCIGVRKLQPVARWQGRHRTLGFCDRVGKIRVKGDIWQSQNNWLIALRPLRGYHKDFKRVNNDLKRAKGQPHSDGPMCQIRLSAQRLSVPFSNKLSFIVASDMRPAQALMSMASDMLQQARKNEPGIVSHAQDTEFVHDYRVCLRKVRALLSIAKPVLAHDYAAMLKRTLKSLMHPSGPVRDMDVMMLHGQRLANLIPAPLQPDLEPMMTAFLQQQQSALKHLQSCLTSAAGQQHVRQLETWLETPELRPQQHNVRDIGPYIHHMLCKRLDKVVKTGNRIGDHTPDEDVHALRIACKKIRYLLEFFSCFYAREPLQTLTRQLKALQDILGQFNDCCVQRARLNDYLARDSAASVTTAVTALEQALHAQQTQHRSQVQSAFRRFTRIARDNPLSPVYDG